MIEYKKYNSNHRSSAEVHCQRNIHYLLIASILSIAPQVEPKRELDVGNTIKNRPLCRHLILGSTLEAMDS
jgi:hypothetical protein